MSDGLRLVKELRETRPAVFREARPQPSTVYFPVNSFAAHRVYRED